jgi:hypothetical protein
MAYSNMWNFSWVFTLFYDQQYLASCLYKGGNFQFYK